MPQGRKRQTPQDIKPFTVERFGPRGPDSPKHLFCVIAIANQEAVRLGCSATSAAINGASGSDPRLARVAVQRMADELNAVFARYMRGEFHE